MATSFTDEFGLDKLDFLSTGAFDTILDVDSRVFIGPALLDGCKIPEFVSAREKAEKYFSNIIPLLSHSQNSSDMFWRKADKMLTFTELTGTCIGYSQNGTAGNSIGKHLRSVILHTIKDLIIAGEKDPTLFELLGVFQEGIDCDRVSDLLTFILSNDILEFTHRIVVLFGLQNHKISYSEKEYFTCLNKYNGKPILLLPSAILSPLIIADGYDDIDRICFENARVRQEINAYFDMENRKTKLSKVEILQLMKSSSSFRNALITAYRYAPAIPYDFENNPVGEYAWYNAAKEYVEKYPMRITLPHNPTIADVISVVESICERYKSLHRRNLKVKMGSPGFWSIFRRTRD
jgi:hypothetical protein